MRKFLGFLLFLSVLVACVGPQRYTRYEVNEVPDVNSYMPEVIPVWIDVDFSQPELDAIHAALADWNFALNGYRQYRIETDKFAMQVSVLKHVEATGQGLIILAVSEAAMPDQLSGGVLGWVNELGDPVIFIAHDRIGSRDLKTIVMHEMGHTMGLSHVAIMGALMSPYYNYQTGKCVDVTAVMALAGLRRTWDWRHMNYCDLTK